MMWSLAKIGRKIWALNKQKLQQTKNERQTLEATQVWINKKIDDIVLKKWVEEDPWIEIPWILLEQYGLDKFTENKEELLIDRKKRYNVKNILWDRDAIIKVLLTELDEFKLSLSQKPKVEFSEIINLSFAWAKIFSLKDKEENDKFLLKFKLENQNFVLFWLIKYSLPETRNNINGYSSWIQFVFRSDEERVKFEALFASLVMT